MPYNFKDSATKPCLNSRLLVNLLYSQPDPLFTLFHTWYLLYLKSVSWAGSGIKLLSQQRGTFKNCPPLIFSLEVGEE